MHPLTSALDRDVWSPSSPDRFTPQGKSPWYPLDRRLGGPQSRSESGEKLLPVDGIRTPDHPARSSEFIPLSYPGYFKPLSYIN
jgi:hypothetical protein